MIRRFPETLIDSKQSVLLYKTLENYTVCKKIKWPTILGQMDYLNTIYNNRTSIFVLYIYIFNKNFIFFCDRGRKNDQIT